MSSYPDFVEERINSIKDITKISADKIREYYEGLFNDDFVQKYKFETDAERHEYCMTVLSTRFISRPPPIEPEAVPVILRVHASVKAWLYARVRADEELSALLYDLLDLLQEMNPAHQEVSP